MGGLLDFPIKKIYEFLGEESEAKPMLENGNSECSEIEEINPIQYMMGNLMKKIDENKETAREDEETISPDCSTTTQSQTERGAESAVKTISSEFERTILESRAARLDSDQLKQEQDIQLNESAVLQLKKVRISPA